MRKPGKDYGKKPFEWSRIVTIGILIISAVIVAGNAAVALLYNPEEEAKAKFEEIARGYYEDYYYDKLDPEMLPRYETKGLPAVTLRVLLTYAEGRNAALEEYFVKRMGCDAIATKVVFSPQAPWGVKDYTPRAVYSCNF